MTTKMPLPEVVCCVVIAWWQMNQRYFIINLYFNLVDSPAQALVFLLRTFRLFICFPKILSIPASFVC